jgi:hypothetical protein
VVQGRRNGVQGEEEGSVITVPCPDCGTEVEFPPPEKSSSVLPADVCPQCGCVFHVKVTLVAVRGAE